MTEPMSAREFDVVVYGASGFTGRLVAEYLAERCGPDVRWAMAGRSRAKLAQVRDEVAGFQPRAADAPLVIADSDDPASLDAMARRTRVVATTAGPYLRYGLPVAAACAANGTGYCDLTGEVPFIRRVIDAHHAEARRTGARIVPSCGYDSIPSDLGVRMLHEAAKARGLGLARVRYFAGKSRGGLSGGTAASMVNLLNLAGHDASLRRLMADPYALDPDDGARGPDGADALAPRFDQDMGAWVGPFVMAAINTRVVRRSNALLGYPYGREFRYSEEVLTGRGPKGAVAAALLAGVVGGAMASVGLGPLRALVGRVIPKPGEGPSRAVRDGGFFRTHLVAHTRGPDGAPGPTLRGLVVGQKDPGYGETAKMLAESALCLARGEGEATEGGVLTPASALGMPLVARLRSAGMTFEVEA